MRFSLAILVLVPTLVFASGQGRTPTLSAKDVSAIRSVDTAYVQAVLARDWDKLASLLTSDAAVMPPNEVLIVGRPPNLARFQAFKLTSVEYAHVPAYVGGEGEVAYLQGTYTVRMTFPDVTQPYTDRGKYLWVLRKQSNGAWLIERLIWNTDLPRSAA